MAENSLESQIAVIMEKAVRSLDAAKTLLTSGSSDFSSSRSYYAVFYALQALLLTKGLVFSKHAGVSRIQRTFYSNRAVSKGTCETYKPIIPGTAYR